MFGLDIDRTAVLAPLAMAYETLGQPLKAANNLTALLGHVKIVSATAMVQLLLGSRLILIPAVLLTPRLLSGTGIRRDGPGSDAISVPGRLVAKAKALIPARWMSTYQKVTILLPYFVPAGRESARGMARTLAAMAACICAQRVLNVVSPLLLRRIIDTLSLPVVAESTGVTSTATTPATTVTAAAAAAAASSGSRILAEMTGGGIPGDFPWASIVAYVLSRHLINRLFSSYRRAMGRTIWVETSDRIAKATYRHLLALGADFHEGGDPRDAKGEKKKEEDDEEGKRKKSGEEERMLQPSMAWNTVCNSSSGAAHFIVDTLSSTGPTLLDLALGLVAFGRVSGGRVAAAMGFVLLLYLAALVRFEDAWQAKWDKTQRLKAARALLAADAVRNWATVSVFAREGYEQARFEEASSDLVAHRRDEARMGLFFQDARQDATRLVLVGGMLGLGLIAGWQIRRGERGIGDFVMLMQYWSELVDHVRQLLDSLRSMDEFDVDVDRLIGILERRPTVVDGEGAAAFEPKEKEGGASIEFDRVVFSYPGAKKPALDDVSFSVAAGQTLAVVGETGGGKSTLLKLLCRLRDCSSGAVRVDGQDVRHVTRASLLEHIAVVPQVVSIFGASVRNNVCYGRLDATDADVEAACEAARLHSKIVGSFAGGYDERVGAGGKTQLSGGERQRLAIARALVRGGGARVVLLDEAMSSLDAETEWEIQHNVREWCRGRTVVIVSHRLATVKRADLIVAIRDGRLVEKGTHKELLAKEGYYHSLWTKQTPEE